MNSIQAIGDFFQMDKSGFLINPCLQAPFGHPWDAMLSEIQTFLRKKYPHHIHSIWLRGSVARGLGVAGQSDLDVFALIKEEGFHWGEMADLAELQALLEPLGGKDFPLECQLESYSGRPEDLRSQIAMLIATQSVCLWGEDLRPMLGKYRPGKEMMLEYRWIAADVKEALEKIQKGEVLEKGAFCSQMKSIIRAGFELVMEREGRYTRDLYPAYQAFSKYYPRQESEMRKALFWYLNPTPPAEELQDFLQGFASWLAGRF